MREVLAHAGQETPGRGRGECLRGSCPLRSRRDPVTPNVRHERARRHRTAFKVFRSENHGRQEALVLESNLPRRAVNRLPNVAGRFRHDHQEIEIGFWIRGTARARDPNAQMAAEGATRRTRLANASSNSRSSDDIILR